MQFGDTTITSEVTSNFQGKTDKAPAPASSTLLGKPVISALDRPRHASSDLPSADAELASTRLHTRIAEGDEDPELEAALIEFDATILKQDKEHRR